MSFRSVEMQIAIPRTSEIGSAQTHLMHKPAYDQTALADKISQQKERELLQSTKVEESSAAFVREHPNDKGGKRKERQMIKSGKPQQAAESERAAHPYKGQHIDFSL